MKNSIKKVVLTGLLLFTLTGCTKYLKDSEDKSVINPKTGQNLTENILCRPTDEETINTAEIPSETTRESATVPEISSEPESKTETVTVNPEPLLTLKVFTEKIWKNEGTERLAEGYVVIKDQTGLIYTCKLGKTDEHRLDISTKQVTENFNIIK